MQTRKNVHFASCMGMFKAFVRSSHRRCSAEIVFLKISQNLQKNTFESCRLQPAILCRKILAQAFSCEFCEIYRNTVLKMHLQVTASVNMSSSDSCGALSNYQNRSFFSLKLRPSISSHGKKASV